MAKNHLTILGSLLAATFASQSYATDRNTIAPGDWVNPAIWGGTVPGSSDDGYTHFAQTITSTAPNAHAMFLLPNSSVTISSTGSITTVNTTVFDPSATLTVNSGGTLNVGGSSLTMNGIMALDGTATITGGRVQVGVNGTGTLTQTGTLTTPFMQVGDGSVSTAVNTYNLNAGSLMDTGDFDLGATGEKSGTFNQSGGTASISGLLSIGSRYSGGETGLLHITGGTFSANQVVIHPVDGAGTFEVTGAAATSITANSFSLAQNGAGTLLDQINQTGISEIQVAGTATFGASNLIHLDWIPGTTFSAGTSFDLLTAPTFSGTPILDPADAGTWSLSVIGSGPKILRATLLVDVPEPATLSVMALGASGLLLRKKRA